MAQKVIKGIKVPKVKQVKSQSVKLHKVGLIKSKNYLMKAAGFKTAKKK